MFIATFRRKFFEAASIIHNIFFAGGYVEVIFGNIIPFGSEDNKRGDLI